MACGGYLSITNPDEPGEWKRVSKNVSEFSSNLSVTFYLPKLFKVYQST